MNALAKYLPLTNTAGINQSIEKSVDTGIMLEDLIDLNLPESKFVIDGLIPEGFSIIAGRPKQGKSWLVLQSAIGIGGGYPCMGAAKVEKRPVLYLALEDTHRRLKDRASKILAATHWQAGSSVDLRVRWPRASAGGLLAIREWLQEHRGGLVLHHASNLG
ncbi:MAG: AAA family ATPase [Gemmataceae bacterium]